MAQIGTWDLSQFAISLGALQFDSGFGDTDVLSVEADQTDWTFHKGADGSFTRSKMLAKTAKAKLTLGQSSLLNDVLSAQRITDKATPGGAGYTAFQAKDLGGTTLITAAHAYIEGPPVVDIASESKEREWTLVLADAEIFVGGNPAQ